MTREDRALSLGMQLYSVGTPIGRSIKRLIVWSKLQTIWQRHKLDVKKLPAKSKVVGC